MTALSTLRTRLARRLGREDLPTRYKSRLDEAINAAILRIVSEGTFGVNKRSLTARTFGSITPSNDGVVSSVGDTTVTFTGETFLSDNIYRGDILKLGTLSYTIWSVTDTVLGVGAPLTAAGTTAAASVTIYRRGIKLPVDGVIPEVVRLDDTGRDYAEGMDWNPDAWVRWPNTISHGAGMWDAHYDPDANATIISVFPASAASEFFQVRLSDVPTALSADGDDLDWPTPTIEALLAKAAELMMGFGQTADAVILSKAGSLRRDAADGITQTSSGSGYLGR